MITRVELVQFTAFEKLAVDLSPGINVLIGANGTGKTHILKAVHAACDITKSQRSFADKINGVFMPSEWKLGRLVHRRRGGAKATLSVSRRLANARRPVTLQAAFSSHATRGDSARVTGAARWCSEPIESVYVPVKEMLANAPGFRSMVTSRVAHFEEVYSDVVNSALLPLLRGAADAPRRRILKCLGRAMDGSVTVKNEEFFLRSREGNLEFSLLAEGIRKLGLLWVLVQNGTLLKGSVLCWDEPEANLNPRMMRIIAEILLELQRMGVQILLATHDYVLLKELDLQAQERDELAFHSLYRSAETGPIAMETAKGYLDIHPNAIADTFADLYDRDMDRALTRGQPQ